MESVDMQRDWTQDKTVKRLHSASLKMLSVLDTVCKNNHIEYCLAFGTLLGAIRHKGYIPWDDDMDVWMTRENFEKLMKCRDQFPEEYAFVPSDEERMYFDSTSHLYYKNVHLQLDPAVEENYGKLKTCLHLDIGMIDNTYKGFRGNFQRVELCVLSGLLGGWRHKALRERHPMPIGLPLIVLQFFGRGVPLSWLRKRYAKVASRYNHKKDTNACFHSNGAFVKYLFPKRCFDKIIYTPFETTELPIPGGYDEILRILYGDYMQLPPPEDRHFRWAYILTSPEDYVFEQDA